MIRLTFTQGYSLIALKVSMAVVSMVVVAPLASGQNRYRGDRVEPNLNEFYSTVGKNASLEDLKKADELRLKTVESIHALLKKKAHKDPQRFELLLRLGELHAERHDYIRDMELRDYEQSYQRWEASSKKGKEPQLSTNKSQKELGQAVSSFRSLVTKYPKHPRTAAALFALGKTLVRMGNSNALLYFKDLIKHHKGSELIPDAHLAMGELYFQDHKIDLAIDAYQKAMKYKDHHAYPYMVYKLGWSYFNATPKNEAEEAQLSDKAISAFKLVVKLADRDRAQQGRYNLREEALRDLVMVWADSERVEDAWTYFRELDEDEHFYKLLERLGAIYAEQGQNAKATAVYQRLLGEAPDREENPSIHAKVVGLMELQGRDDELVKTMEQMHQQYLNKGVWVDEHDVDAEVIERARLLVEKTNHRFATLFHKQAQKSKNKQKSEVAIQLYQIYLKSFAKEQRAYELRYYLADLLFDSERYQLAAQHYDFIVKQDPKGKHHRDAALNAVLAFYKADDRQEKVKLPALGEAKEAVELPQHKTQLLAAIDQFVLLYPNAKEADAMVLSASQIYFEFGHYKEALNRFARVVTDRPKSKESKVALQNLFVFLSQKKHWKTSILWAKKLGESETVIKAGHGKAISEHHRLAQFSYAQSLEEKKAYAKAATEFLNYQKTFAKDADADRALYNASLNFYKVAAVDKALEAAELLIQLYPKSKLQAEVMLTSAESYEALARFKEAADHYERLASGFPSRQEAPLSLFNAAVLAKNLEQSERALRLFAKFSKSYPQHELVSDSVLQSAILLEQMSKYQEAAQAYGRYAHDQRQSDPNNYLMALAKEASMYGKASNVPKMQHLMGVLTKTLSKEGSPPAYEARRITARLSFDHSESRRKQFLAIKIDRPERIEAIVAKKQKLLEQLADDYQKVMALSNPEHTVASLYRLGELHEDFAQMLFQAPGLQNVDQNTLNQYRSELEQVAFPLKEQAMEFFETAYQRAREVETFSDWTAQAYAKMADLNSEKYPDVPSMTPEPRYVQHELPLMKELSSLN